MPANDGNQTAGSPSNFGSGGLSTPGPAQVGSLVLTNATLAGAATAGAIVPADFVGFIEVTVNGAIVKIPYYNV
jgi:hypothetical protein